MGKIRDTDKYDGMALVIAPHKGIVDADTWIRCRLKAEQNIRIANRRKSHRTWVSGKLKCGKCGYALRYNKWTGKTVENEYYICSEVSGSRRCEGIGAVRKELIESEVLRHVQKKINSIELERSGPSHDQAEINAISIAIAKREAEIDELLTKFEGGGEAVMRRLNQKVDGIEGEIHGLKQELLKLEKNRVNKKQIDADVIEEIFESWDDVPMSDRQAVADILIKKVLVTGKGIEIVWKI